MIDSLKNFFKSTEAETIHSLTDFEIFCGLMIEAANIDGNIDSQELSKISNILLDVFDEDLDSVDREIKKYFNDKNDLKSLHFFTSRINKQFSIEKKIMLIEILWEIILEDGKIHDFESNLIRRLAGLLYISDVECGKAKIKVSKKLDVK